MAAAEEALRLAELKLQEMTGPPDVDSETVALDQAQGAFDRATAALQDLEARSGPTVPLGEIVFVNALPATVSSLSAEVGETVGETADNDDFGQPGSQSAGRAGDVGASRRGADPALRR